MPRSALILDGASGPALAFTRSLGRAGWRVLVPAGTRSAASRYASVAVSVPEADFDPRGFVAGVGEVCAGDDVDVVVPCTDASVELLWANEDALGDARVVGGDRESAALGTDKARSLAAADEAGFPTPEWEAPETVEEAVEAVGRIGLPCVLKPRRSYVAVDGRLLHRRHGFVDVGDDPAGVIAEFARVDGSVPVLEAYVPGRSISVSAVLRDGEVLARVARETLTFDPIAGGTSVWKRTIPPDDAGVAEAVDLLRSIGYEGLAEVEYQVDRGGTPRLMEIGVRAHGWVGLAVAAGVDLPLIAANAVVGDSVPKLEGYRVGVEMRWPAGEVGRLRTALARNPGLPPGVRRRDVLATAWPPWRPGMRYDGLDLDDLRPWLPARLRGAGAARRASP